MNKEQTLAAIAVMQAYVDGKTIECRFHGKNDWITFKDGEIPAWDWGCCDYRVKPEPREWWMNLYPKGSVPCLHASKAEADEAGSEFRTECIHVREVIK